MPFTNILVPTDYSETSRKALKLAAELGRQRGATITLLRVAPIGELESYLAMVPRGVLMMREMTDQLRAAEEERMRQLITEDLPDYPGTAVRYSEGFPPEVILHELEEGDYDLVVMGTHGRSGLGRVVLGSVAERVLRRSPVPVLTTT